MIKDVRYIIKKVIIFTLVGMLLFIFKSKVTLAMANDYNVYINNNLLNYNTRIYTSGATNMTLKISESSTAQLDYTAKNYFYVAICSAFGSYDNRYISALNPGSYITDLRVVNSTTGCTIPNNADYKNTARVVYFSFRVKDSNIDCGANGPCALAHPVTFEWYQPTSNEFSFVSWGVSYDEYNFTDTINPVVNQVNSVQNTLSSWITQAQQDHAEEMAQIQAVHDAITEDFLDSDSNEMKSWLGNFSSDTFGLTSIITAPLTTIESLTSSTCQPLELPLPHTNEVITLPCMTSIYSSTFGTVFTMYQTITTGLIGYWVVINIFRIVKGMKDPNDDKIEVVDL